jgi:hypothetical protein
MAQHIWTVPCRFSTIDRQSNNVSLIEVLEEITVPTVLPQQPDVGIVPAIFDVTTLWSRENDEQPESGFGRMSFLSPAGQTVFTNEYEIDLRENRRFRSIGRVLGFPAQVSGRCHFRVDRRRSANDDWEQVAMVPVWVNILRENAPESNGGVQ